MRKGIQGNDDEYIEIVYREPEEAGEENEGRAEGGEAVSSSASEEEEGRNEVSKRRSEVKIGEKKQEEKASRPLPPKKKSNEIGDEKQKKKEREVKPSLKKPNTWGKTGELKEKKKRADKQKIEGKQWGSEMKNKNEEIRSAGQELTIEGKVDDSKSNNKVAETVQNPQPPAKEPVVYVRRSALIGKRGESKPSGDAGESNAGSGTPSEGVQGVDKPKENVRQVEEDGEAEQRDVKQLMKGKKDEKKQKKEVVDSKGKRNDIGKQHIETKKDNKIEHKKVVKSGKKDNIEKKKQEVVEDVMEVGDKEESDKSKTALYKFPMKRISRIIKSDDFNNRIAQEAIFAINKASEKFLELMSKEAYACAFLDHKNHVMYNHLSSVVSKRRRFDFLTDFVPKKVKAEDAVAEMSKADA